MSRKSPETSPDIIQSEKIAISRTREGGKKTVDLFASHRVAYNARHSHPLDDILLEPVPVEEPTVEQETETLNSEEMTIVTPTIDNLTIVTNAPQRRSSKDLITVASLPLAQLLQKERGYFRTFNDISDKLIPALKLNTAEQSVFNRMWRLSRGNQKAYCEVGYGGLAKACNVTTRTVQDAVAALIERGVIALIDHAGFRGTARYHVLPFLTLDGELIMEDLTIDKMTIVKNKMTIVKKAENWGATIVKSSDSKRNKDLKENIKKGIRLTPEEIKTCPDCNGSGFFYPEGTAKGVKRCNHTKVHQLK